MSLATSIVQRSLFAPRHLTPRVWRQHASNRKLQTPDVVPLFRVASQNDLSNIVDIERASGSSTSLEQLQEELDRECSLLMVAQVADAVVAGYALAWLVLDELQIFDVVVHPHYRRRGLARQLLLALLDERAGTVAVALLEVRVSNGAAIALYDQLGFKQVGRRKKYYSDGEDAILMNKDLPGS